MDETSKGQYIRVNDVDLHYFEEGQGEPVLFLHAIGQSIYTFRKNLPVLAGCAHVIALDLPGHGLSAKPDIRYTIPELTEYINAFLTAMDLRNVTVVGFSSGAVLALNLALHCPDAVSRLVLLSPGGLTKSCPSKLKHATVPLLQDILFTFFNKHMVDTVLSTAYYDLTSLTPEVIRQYYKTLSNKDNRDALIQALSNWKDSGIAYELSELNIPTYILWGEKDTWHPIDHLELYEDAISDLYVGTLKKCGHMLHEERYLEVNAKLQEILSSKD